MQLILALPENLTESRMSLGPFIFSIAATGYILLGIYLEERDLVKAHGQAYRNYREQVHMPVPFFKASKDKSEFAVAASRLDRAPRT
jgi:protein-S-isoprenylcysteine O-methyltransferase Ste14